MMMAFRMAFTYLLLILMISEMDCYDTVVSDLSILKDDILQMKRENLRRFKRVSFK